MFSATEKWKVIATKSEKVPVCGAHANVQWPIKITSDPKLVSYSLHLGPLLEWGACGT